MRYSLAVLAVMVYAGCGDENLASDDAAADSAGVEIVANTRSTVLNVPAFTLEEDLRIGAMDGPEQLQFFRIRAVREGPAGEILVLDGGHNVVRVFGAQGEFLYALGGPGDGPGEFRSASRLAVAGDTILVADRELSMFVGRTHASTVPIVDPAFRGSLQWIGHSAHGWVGAYRRRGYPVSERTGRGPFVDTLTIGHLDPITATVRDTILVLPMSETYLLGTAGWIMNRLFARDPRFAVALDGRTYFTPGDDYVIDVLDNAGRHVRRIRADVERIPITKADLDEYFERRRADAGPDPQGETALALEEIGREYPSVPLLPYRPIPGLILAAPGGRILVERLDLGPEPLVERENGTTWDLFDESGRLIGRNVIPQNITPVELTDDALYTITRDDLDVQYVVRYTISTTHNP